MFTLTAQPPLFIFKGLGAPAGPGEIFTYAVIDTTLMHRRVLSYLVMWSLPLTRFPLLIIPPFPALVCSSHSNSSNTAADDGRGGALHVETLRVVLDALCVEALGILRDSVGFCWILCGGGCFVGSLVAITIAITTTITIVLIITVIITTTMTIIIPINTHIFIIILIVLIVIITPIILIAIIVIIVIILIDITLLSLPSSQAPSPSSTWPSSSS